MSISPAGRWRKTLYILQCICIVIPLSAHSKTYELVQLIKASEAYQPVLQVQQARADQAGAQVTEARHAALPILRLHEQLNLASANGATGTYFPLGTIIPTSGAIRASNNAQPATGNIGMLYSEYELADFGLRKARVQDARSGKTLADAGLVRSIYLNQVQVVRDYFELLKTYRQLDVERQNVLRYDTLLIVIRAQTTSGLKAAADSSQTLAELSKARQALNVKEGQIDQLKVDLARLTGLVSNEIDINKEITVQTDPSGGNSYILPDDNPLLRYYYLQKERSIAQGKLIRKSYQPKILLVGGLWAHGTSIDYHGDYMPLSQGLGYDRFNYGIGLTLSYNLFDLIHKKDKLNINRFETRQQEYNLQQETLELKSAAQKAVTALEVIRKNKAELKVQLKALTALYSQKLAQYRAGISNLVELTNAAYLLYQVQSDEVQLQTDWLMASLDRATADGTLSLFIQSIK